MQESGSDTKPGFGEALRFWLWLGCVSFGGPAGQIALMQEHLVDRKRWIPADRFQHALSYCMLLPGPEAQQLAIYTGWLLHGVRGGLAAGLLFIFPSLLLLMGLLAVYLTWGQQPVVLAVFRSLYPAVIALVMLALGRMAHRNLKGPLPAAVALLSFGGMYFLQWPFPLILLGAAVAGLLFPAPMPEIVPSPAAPAPWLPRLLRQSFVSLLLWALPLGLALMFLPCAPFWKDAALFFTQSALITFGGAYAVLPWVSDHSVHNLNWLTQAQMVDGLALGETTPGPLIMVLAWVGGVAAWNRCSASLAAGMGGMVYASFYTFLPGFFFVFAGAPLLEHSHRLPRMQQLMRLIPAAVTGVMLVLALNLMKSMHLPGGHTWLPGQIWVCVSLLALGLLRVPAPLWILITALAGLLAWAAGI